jgi:hypothetical protein
LKETPKGKTIDYSTDLTIKAFEGDKIKFIDESIDSKSKNDITFLTKIIEVLKNAFKSGDEKEFQYAISFLKKMSGDWLQVLLTLAIATGTRGFTPYKSPENRIQGAIRQNITGKIDHVYFVTHDQIALSFALMMKVECLFTHHGPVEGNPSLHSAFLFSLPNEEALNASIIAKAEALGKNYEGDITELTAGLKTYNENCETALNSSKVDLASYLDGYLRGDVITPFEVDVFDKYVKTIFTTALKFVATKKLLPDLTDTQISIGELTKKNTELQSKIAAFKKGDALVVTSAKDLLELDARISSEMQHVKKIIDKAKDFFRSDDEETKKTEMNIKNKIRDFTKTLIYTSADKWTWDSPEVNNRSLSKLTTVAETKTFNADRNIFVNHLDALDDETKSKITLLFAKCYRYISTEKDQKYGYTPIKKKGGENKIQELTPMQIMKFKPMATTFCYEVFINFGGKFSGTNIKTSGITQEINDYCEGIISANEVLLLWDDVLEGEEKESRAIMTGPDHLSEAVLVAQMNDDAKILDTGVDSFNAPVEESVQVKEPKKSQSKMSMNINSVFSACNLLKQRLFSTPKHGGERAYSAFGGFSAFSRRGPAMKGGAPTCNFHPQLPLYILMFQLHKTLTNENYKESHDFELALQTYDFLLQMEKQMDKIEDKCEFALSIRDLFFINNVVSDKIKVKKVPILPPKILSFMGLLTTEFCGALNETYFGDVKDRDTSINNPVFTAFIKSVDVADCFNTPFDLVMDEIKYTDFVDAVSESARDLAQQIVADRGSDNKFKQDVYESKMTDLALLKNDTGVFGFGKNGAIPAYGGRKTRRNRKRRTRRPSKNVVGKKTRKRSRK